MRISFNLEASMEEWAFFALYAGLQKIMKSEDSLATPGQFSLVSAEAYCLEMQLKEKHSKMYKWAVEQYKVYYPASETTSQHAQVTYVDSEGEAYRQKVWDALAPEKGEPKP